MDDVQNHQVEVTYAAATGRWIGADWTHEAHSGRGPCATCAAAGKAAHAAEAAAAIALEAARAGDWVMAVALAQCVTRLEDEWTPHASEGAATIWGAFASAVIAAAGATAVVVAAEGTDDTDDADDPIGRLDRASGPL